MDKPHEEAAGYKHRSTDKFMNTFKKTVMDRCQQEGLHQIDLLAPAERKITQKEYMAQKHGQQKLDEMISSFLSEKEKMIVAAHELGHIILHRSQLKMTPMQDDTLYNMTDNTEYQANLFAADLLIDDEEIEDMVQNEDLDYFGLCSSLNATPELMSFKLYSLTKRGQAYHMPMEIQSNFLAK